MRGRRIAAAALACLVGLALPASGAETERAWRQALSLAARAHGIALEVPTIAADETTTPGMPYPDALAILMPAVREALSLRDRALASVDAGELAAARRIVEQLDPAPADTARALSIIERIDMAAMARGAAVLLDAVERALPHFTGEGPAEPTCSPNGLLCIGTEADDVYTDDVGILIDPGGNDTYLNNAGGVLYQPGFESTGGCAFGGGTTGHARPNLSCTSAPSSVCTYDTANRAAGSEDLPTLGVPGHADPAGPDGGRGADGSCGSDARREAALEALAEQDRDADARGVALLLDLDGSDTYTVPWAHEDPLFGLIDACFPGEEHVRNTNRDLFQGSALGGIGILWDTGAGDDLYRGRLNAQGSGHVGGVGVLVAEGEGDATFWADRLAQGNGIGGGIGVLATSKVGTHTYLLDAPVVYRNEFAPAGRECAQEGRAGQGQGGFAGVGVLWNSGGEAVYRAVTHRTEDVYPYAAVLDDQGLPVLVGGNDAQASGESFPIVDTPGGVVAGVGVLVDDTDGDAGVCPAGADAPDAGMLTGSGPDVGISLSSIGVVDRACGTFNLPASIDPAHDLGAAVQRILAGALGVRVVL